MANLVEIVITGKNLATPAMDEASAGAKGLSGVMAQMGAVSAAALVGVAAESVKMATTYESSTTRLVTSANETTANLDLVRKGMLDMAGQVGTSANDLAKGMYTVESAGFHGADGLTVLKAAAQGAKDENADLGTVANGVTDVLNDYHDKASDAANVTSQLVTAVSFGKTNFQEFSTSLSNILPLAASVHLGLSDVTGVLAEMTAHGMSAQRASQDEANAIRSLIAPTAAMEKEFKALGISSEQVRQKLGADGLAGTMDWLSQVAQKGAPKIGQDYTEAMKKLMGTAPGLVTALMTTGENANDTTKAIQGIAGASADAQGNVKGFSEVQKTLAQQVSELKAGFDSLMIELGDKLIPVLTSTVGWFVKHKEATLDILKATGLFLVALASYTIAAKAAAVATTLWAVATGELDLAEAANPVGLIAIAIVALIAIIYELVKHWKTVWGDIKKWAQDAWHFIYDGFGKYLLPLLGPGGFLMLGIIELAKHWKTVWGDISGVALAVWRDALKPVFDAIGTAAKWLYENFLKPNFESAAKTWEGLGAAAMWLWNVAIKPVFDFIGAAAVWLYDNIIKPTFGFMEASFDAVGSAAVWLWSNAISPALHGIGDAVSWLYNNVWKPVWGAIAGAASEAWNIIGPIVNSIEGAVSRVSNAVGGLSGVAKSVGSFLGHFGLATGGEVGGAATGKEIGGLTWVGEQGPELVRLPVGSTVRSNPDSAAMTSSASGGGGRLQIEWVGGNGGDELMAWIRKNIRVRYGSDPRSVQKALGYTF